MSALPWICALQLGAVLCSFQGSEPMREGEPPARRGDAPSGLFTPRWLELRQTYGIERPQGWRSEIYIHRLPPQHGILHVPPWERIVDDIIGWFDDLRDRWPQVEWWVRRVHGASASSSMPLLQHVNYVLISGDDFHAFANNPHGLMELGFEEPQLCTTVLPRLLNLPILRTFLAPLWAGIPVGITVRAFLNGVALAHQLVACDSGFGFYLRVTWEGNTYLMAQLSSHTLQLHRPPTIVTGAYIHNRGTTVFIPGGNTLIMSRKVTLIGPNNDRDIEGALRRRFPDLAQDNFGIGQVHSSYYLVEPVARPGWLVQLVIPIVEDDNTPVVLFKAVLSTYEGLGAIYVPPIINKYILITDTGLDIVCGPQGELCACYHNGLPMSQAHTDVSDLDFLSCSLNEEELVSSVSDVLVGTCDVGHFQQRSGSLCGARS